VFGHFRAWYDDERLMMGYVATPPDADSAGAGTAIIDAALVADPAAMQQVGMQSMMTFISWENTSSTATLFDGYSSGIIMKTPDDDPVDLTIGRIVAAGTTVDGTEKMTLQTAAFFGTDLVVPVPQAGGGTLNITVDEVLFNSQYLIDGTYLVFENHFLLDDTTVPTGDPEVNNVPLCGIIATGNPATPGDPADVTLCTGEGLSLTGLEYPALVVGDAVKTQFPAASVFPETPTF
jgi:hypothetical protein